jgi:hypothetical protein
LRRAVFGHGIIASPAAEDRCGQGDAIGDHGAAGKFRHMNFGEGWGRKEANAPWAALECRAREEPKF